MHGAIGTVGLIRASREQTDGRSNLILHGVLRVEFTDWLFEKSTHSPQFNRLPRFQFPILRPSLSSMTCERRLLGFKKLSGRDCRTDQKPVEQVAQSPAAFADVIAQQFILDPAMRRKLWKSPALKSALTSSCTSFETPTATTGIS